MSGGSDDALRSTTFKRSHAPKPLAPGKPPRKRAKKKAVKKKKRKYTKKPKTLWQRLKQAVKKWK